MFAFSSVFSSFLSRAWRLLGEEVCIPARKVKDMRHKNCHAGAIAEDHGYPLNLKSSYPLLHLLEGGIGVKRLATKSEKILLTTDKTRKKLTD